MYKYLLLIIWLVSCASIKYPEGGPKDEQPPIVKAITPNLPKTRFNEKKIELKFNEYIKNEDYSKEILFSPPLNPPAKVLTYGKKIKIILPNTLDQDITYTLTIGKNIKDFNEGNSIDTIQQFPFTSSERFDSCKVFGELIQSHPKMKLDNYVVFLYDLDSVQQNNFHNKAPTYFGLTNESYQYQINFVKPGKYKILAVQDKNHDFKYNEGENIGIDSDIFVNFQLSHQIEKDLYCFPSDIQFPKIKKSYWKDSLNYWMEFSEPILKDSLKINISTNHKCIVTDQKLEIYFPKFVKDSIKIEIFHLMDTLGNKVDTSLKIILNKTNSVLHKYSFSAPEVRPDEWIFKANAILNDQDKSKIFILDTLNNPINLPISITNNILKIKIDNHLDTSQIYTVKIDSSFVSYQNQKLDSTLYFKIQPKSEEDYYGYLKLNIICDYPNFVGYLKNTQTKDIIMFKDKNLIFNKLIPGKYQMVIFNDEDQNGLWSTGNPKILKLPEDIYIFPQEIEIKSSMKIENLEIKVE